MQLLVEATSLPKSIQQFVSETAAVRYLTSVLPKTLSSDSGSLRLELNVWLTDTDLDAANAAASKTVAVSSDSDSQADGSCKRTDERPQSRGRIALAHAVRALQLQCRARELMTWSTTTNPTLLPALGGLCLYSPVLVNCEPAVRTNPADGFCWYNTAATLVQAVAAPPGAASKTFAPAAYNSDGAVYKSTVDRSSLSQVIADLTTVLCEHEGTVLATKFIQAHELKQHKARVSAASAALAAKQPCAPFVAYGHTDMIALLRWLPRIVRAHNPWVYVLFMKDLGADTGTSHGTRHRLHGVYGPQGVSRHLCLNDLATVTTGIVVLWEPNHFEYPVSTDKCVLTVAWLERELRQVMQKLVLHLQLVSDVACLLHV